MVLGLNLNKCLLHRLRKDLAGRSKSSKNDQEFPVKDLKGNSRKSHGYRPAPKASADFRSHF